jgi:hypothetical protein
VTDDPLGDYLLLTTIGTKTGTGTETIYTFSLNIDSVELQAYLVGITPSTNSTAFEVRDTVNNIATLPAITCSILPDYTLTGATPAAGSGTLIVDSGATFTVHKTYAMPVDDGTDGFVLKTDGAGVGRWAVDSAGTGTVTNVAVTTANGVSGTVANPTASAAITITLGAITPTTGEFSDTTDATNSTTAPLKTAGGLAVAKKAFIGTLLDLVATTSTAGQITQAGTQFIHSYGTNNLFLGAAGNATVANMSGDGLNVAVGKLALGSATSTTGNMAIGKSSLGAITTSASFANVAIGNQCLDITTSAIEAIAIGNNCQRSIASQYSVTIGNLANAGNYSVAVGYDALNGTNANALACVAIGRQAMKLATGERNTACGHSAGSTITTGTYNSLFGEMAQTGSATATYRTAIGAGAVGAVNNSIKLGRNHTPSVPGDMVILPSVLTANLPTATAAMAGAIIYVSDDGTGHVNFCNGSSWARIN